MNGRVCAKSRHGHHCTRKIQYARPVIAKFGATLLEVYRQDEQGFYFYGDATCAIAKLSDDITSTAKREERAMWW